MAALQEPHLDLEAGGHRRVAGDGGSRSSTATEDSSIATAEIVGVEKGRESNVSDFSVVDLESGNNDKEVHFSRVKRDCRICHLSLDLTHNSENENDGNDDDDFGPENGIPIELGCACKDDLAAAHKHCAEAWFKIKGNKTCEICGSIAQNVAGANEAELMEQWNEANDAMSTATTHGGTTATTSDTRNFWQGHRFLNFLLACMVFAFVISWLFHFNVPS